MTAPGLRLNKRTMTVERAHSALEMEIIEIAEKHQLTSTELAIIQARCIQTTLKYALREERHPGEPDAKADEE